MLAKHHWRDDDGLRIPGLLFADDLVSMIEAATGIRPVVERLETWLNENEMQVGHSKCRLLQIGPVDGFEAAAQAARLQGAPIPIVDSYTYLGIEIRPGFSRARIASERLQKARKLGAVMRSFVRRLDIPIQFRAAVVRTVLIPTLTYGAEIYAFNKSFTKASQKFINEQLKLLAGIPVSQAVSNVALWHEFGVPPICATANGQRARLVAKSGTELKTWLARLVAQGYKARKTTWITNATWWLNTHTHGILSRHLAWEVMEELMREDGPDALEALYAATADEKDAAQAAQAAALEAELAAALASTKTLARSTSSVAAAPPSSSSSQTRILWSSSRRSAISLASGCAPNSCERKRSYCRPSAFAWICPTTSAIVASRARPLVHDDQNEGERASHGRLNQRLVLLELLGHQDKSNLSVAGRISQLARRAGRGQRLGKVRLQRVDQLRGPGLVVGMVADNEHGDVCLLLHALARGLGPRVGGLGLAPEQARRRAAFLAGPGLDLRSSVRQRAKRVCSLAPRAGVAARRLRSAAHSLASRGILGPRAAAGPRTYRGLLIPRLEPNVAAQ